MRGFKVPGQLGSVNAAVAQHDWEHVLADYDTTPMGEIEVISFQTSATRTPGAMLGLVGVLALFESGLMPASLVVSQQEGHNLLAPAGVERMAEAVARGAACNSDLLLDVDFFQHATSPSRKSVPDSPSHPRIRVFSSSIRSALCNYRHPGKLGAYFSVPDVV